MAGLPLPGGPQPRPLTLASDAHALIQEGLDLEARFGRDASNGWAYRIAVRNLRMYQEYLLDGLALRHKNLRIFRLRVRAIGWLLALHKRSVERVYAPGGAGYDLCRAEFEATIAASRKRSAECAPSASPAPHPQQLHLV